MSVRYPTSDSELRSRVRSETQYADNADELPQSDLDNLIEVAKGKVELETGSSNWYSDDGLGFALSAYTCMRCKSAVENIPLANYSLGDENVTFRTSDPDDSQQLQQWAEDVSTGLNASDIDTSGTKIKPRNTSGYIGDSYYDQTPNSP